MRLVRHVVGSGSGGGGGGGGGGYASEYNYAHKTNSACEQSAKQAGRGGGWGG